MTRYNTLISKTYDEADKIEHHLHNRERWAGLAASPSGADNSVHAADFNLMTPFQMDAGNDTWGSWICIMGSSDTPHIDATYTIVDAHRLLITDTERDVTITRIQLGGGANGAAVRTVRRPYRPGTILNL